MVAVVNKLLIATSNAGKIHEVRALLATMPIKPRFVSDLEHIPVEPDETGSTFAENALLKARYYYGLSQLPTLADDSGLSVLELDGFPGVHSSRWKTGSDADRITGLLQLLEERGLTEPQQRRAYFTCTLALVLPEEKEPKMFEGIAWGTLAHTPLGSNGFGYDPIFIPDDHTQTLAQLDTAQKNLISARSLAFKKLGQWLTVNPI